MAQFKYGSTGGDRNFGLPYVMWEAMPSLFRDLLPEGREDEGWAAFGFIYEDEADLPPELGRHRPVGTSLRNHMGIDRIFLNCAGCHAGSVRTRRRRRGADRRRACRRTPSTSSAFQSFLAARRRRRALQRRPLPRRDRRARARDRPRQPAGAARSSASASCASGCSPSSTASTTSCAHEPTFGPGRFDTFNPAKALLNWDFEAICRSASGSAWSTSRRSSCRAPKEGMQLHWDGNNTKVTERNRSAAFGTGATPPILDRESLTRMEDWLETAEPPRFTDVFPGQFDAALAEQGAAVYARECAGCHGASGRDFTGEYVGQGDADRRDRHRPGAARQLHARPRGQPERALRRVSAPSASRPSARPTATPTRRSTGSGCGRPTCTTARCRRWRRCCRRPRSGRGRSCAATTSTTRGRSASSAIRRGSTRRCTARLFCYVTDAGGGGRLPGRRAADERRPATAAPASATATAGTSTARRCRPTRSGR